VPADRFCLGDAEGVPEEGILKMGDDKIGSFAVEYGFKIVNSNVHEPLFQGILCRLFSLAIRSLVKFS
jgi:hypothetical protein